MGFEALEKPIIAGTCLTHIDQLIVGIERVDSALHSEIYRMCLAAAACCAKQRAGITRSWFSPANVLCRPMDSETADHSALPVMESGAS